MQKVVVRCAVGNCYRTPKLELETTCGTETHPKSCKCSVGNAVEFIYYEAWRVGFNDRRPTNPPGIKKTKYDDTAAYESIWNTCGRVTQDGELRFYPDTATRDLISTWSADGRRFGTTTRCPTSAKELYAFDGKDGPPDFWKNESPIASGHRSFEMKWKCCDCDPATKRRSEAWADPGFKKK